MDGGTFVFAQAEGVPALWGRDEQVLWSRGEPLLLVGPPGVGKTTLAQQLVHGLVGIRDELLGLPVKDDGRNVLYLACDRPAQIGRSWKRMLHIDWRDHLAERLRVWPGPLPFDLAAEPSRLRELVEWFKCGAVVIDSLKDVAPGLEKPEVGGGVNAAWQECIAAGTDVVALHHQRKATSENRRPSKLPDVYGSTWLTAGAGSVVLLWGEAGDPIVELSHLKQPADAVGPWPLRHDHDRGRTEVLEAVDPLARLRGAPKGITAKTLASAKNGSGEPSRNDVERARRQLDRLVRDGLAVKRDGDKGKQVPTLYLPATLIEEPS